MGEFELISRYFSAQTKRADVLLGVGDDAALLDVGEGGAVDCALISLGESDDPRYGQDGRRFANVLGCSGLNRLAAAGVFTSWVTLALSLPRADHPWLEEFSSELFDLLSPIGADLVGGDTTRGPLTATLVTHGISRDPQAIRQRAPRGGDGIFLTGEIGRVMPRAFDTAPSPGSDSTPASPRVEAGQAAAAHVCAAADLSSSLGAALSALLQPHGLGAILDPASLPAADIAVALLKRDGGAKLLVETARDPELCLLVPPDEASALTHAVAATGTRLTRIGRVADQTGVRIDVAGR